MIEVLKVLNDHMVQELKLNYEFGQYTETPPKYPYWVGDYTEPEPLEEDGLTTPTVTLTGFARGSFLGLEESKQKIKDYFKDGHFGDHRKRFCGGYLLRRQSECPFGRTRPEKVSNQFINKKMECIKP